jgi:hypothetical protein
MSNRAVKILTIIVSVWVLLSFIGSVIKGDNYKCGKTYAVDYIFFNEAFCEIRLEDNDK